MRKLSKTEKYIVAGAVILIAIAALVGFAFGRGKTPGVSNKAGFPGMNGVGGQMQMNGDKRGPTFGGSGVLGGEILSKEANNLKLQLNDGGSRLVRLSTTTQVQKMAEGSLNDLAVGSSVNVSGQTNADGSLSAKSIQIRPAVPMGAGSGR